MIQPIPMHRCERHNMLSIGNRECALCVLERAKSEEQGRPVTLPAIRGEKTEYLEGAESDGG